MFDFLKKKKQFEIVSPMNGTSIPISEVEDDAFSQKMLGDGVAVIPDGGEVVSPVDGEIIQVFDTLHAYGVRSDDGAEILIHIGINTVELKGKGFKSFVGNGQKVRKGDKIAEVDINLLKENGYLLQTPVILTNIDSVKDIKCNIGKAESGRTVIISYNK